MNSIRTSQSHPLRIDVVQPKGFNESIGMTLCPGKVQWNAVIGEWRRDLSIDLGAIQKWGAVAVLNLLTIEEMRDLRVSQLEGDVLEKGMQYYHLPIEDGGILDLEGEERWSNIGINLRECLEEGDNILIHCKGGLGRTGTMAAKLLVEMGSKPKDAVKAVRSARPGAIENALQERYVHKQSFIIEEARFPEIPTWKNRPQEVEDVKKRFLGCLLGGAAGDALGAPVEFLKLSEIRNRFGPKGIEGYERAYGKLGAITDDTQMTLFTAEGLIRAEVRGYYKGITTYSGVTAHAYLRWLRTQGEHPVCDSFSDNEDQGWLFTHKGLHSRRAPGNTCIVAVRTMRHFGDLAQNDSKGCGGVMRIAPVGLFGWQWRNQEGMMRVFELARKIAALTHGHPTGSLTAGALAVMIMALTDGASLDEALETAIGCLTYYDRHNETLEALTMAKELSKSDISTDQAIRQLGQGWVAEEALAIGVYCALKARSFREGVLTAVNHDGDSDSTGSITGNLLGTMLGLDAIPQEWLKQLELREVIAELGTDLFNIASWSIDQDGEGKLFGTMWEKYPGW